MTLQVFEGKLDELRREQASPTSGGNIISVHEPSESLSMASCLSDPDGIRKLQLVKMHSSESKNGPEFPLFTLPVDHPLLQLCV